MFARGMLYTLVAIGDLDDQAKAETMKNSTGIIKSNRSRTDTLAVETTKPIFPTARLSKSQKEQQEADNDPRIEVYSTLRGDRSGSAIQDMLYAHACAFANGMHYMGACPRRYGINQQNDQTLLNAIGLNSTLRIACPAGDTSNHVFLKEYRKDSYLNNEQWLKYIRSAVRCTRPDSEGGDNVMQVAVHIRRGDVTPCQTGNVTRYKPNSQYLDVLDQYLSHDDNDSDTLPKVQVSIFFRGSIV